MKLHPVIMHETDVFMVFTAVFIVMHMHDGSISFFFLLLLKFEGFFRQKCQTFSWFQLLKCEGFAAFLCHL